MNVTRQEVARSNRKACCRCAHHALKDELKDELVVSREGDKVSKVPCSRLERCRARRRGCPCNMGQGKGIYKEYKQCILSGVVSSDVERVIEDNILDTCKGERTKERSLIDQVGNERLQSGSGSGTDTPRTDTAPISAVAAKSDEAKKLVVPYDVTLTESEGKGSLPTGNKVSVDAAYRHGIDASAQAETEESSAIEMELSSERKRADELQEKLRVAAFTENKLRNEVASSENRLSELSSERDDLRLKLRAIVENEEKRCSEVETELNRMKYAVKEKEEALETERCQLRGMIVELTNIVKIQRKRICEMSRIYDKQRKTLQEKETILVEKESENREILCTCNEMKDQTEKLKNCLKEESRTCDRVKEELESLRSTYRYNVRIKEKIIEDQDEAIKRQKKLLQESEKMAQQAAREFEQLRDEFYCEKRTRSSLLAELNSTQMQLARNSMDCENCTLLRDETECLKRQRAQALDAVRFTLEKLRNAKEEFVRELSCERRQRTFLTTVLRTKDEEIECLKREIFQRGNGNIYGMRGNASIRHS